QGASAPEALREHRLLLRYHLQRQHAGTRAGRRGTEGPHDVRRRLHRLPLRQGRAEPALRLPADQHPVGGRLHHGAGDRADVAEVQAHRAHPSGLFLRAYAFDHLKIVMKKLMPQAETVSEGWPKLGTTDFSSHITKAISSKPDLIVSSVWGGDYVALYKQALRYGMFDKAKFATTLAGGVAPHALGKDHPEGIIAGVHSNYHFTYPSGDKWPLNKTFVEKYHARFNEYPNFQAEGAYTSTYMLKAAIDKANKLVGGWPDDDAIITMLEGMMMAGPAGYVYIRPDNHQGYKDAIIGFSKNVPEYPFPILDPERIITIPIRSITAP